MTAENKNAECSSWMLLLESIKVAVKTPEIENSEISKLLRTYESHDEDWMKYVFFDDKHYTCNLIDCDGTYNLMLLAWNPSQGTCIHNHPNSTSFTKVLSGSLQEIRYEAPEEGQEFKEIKNYVVEKDDVVCMEDSTVVHEMKNDSSNQAISLHLYVPALDLCQKYDRETAAVTVCPVRFNSFYGEKCDHKNGEKCEHTKEDERKSDRSKCAIV